MEGDNAFHHLKSIRQLFQSTPSVWRETNSCMIWRGNVLISIHSLRVEGDWHVIISWQGVILDFNPLPPCGGRQARTSASASKRDFNPLPPCGGRLQISGFSPSGSEFQSTPSVWRETGIAHATLWGMEFQSTPSVWRETIFALLKFPCFLISIHSLRVEGD